MKIILKRNAVSNAIAPLMCAVSGKATLTAADGILINASFPDVCTFTTFDLDKGLKITINATVIEEGSFIINAQKFSQTLRVMGGDEITLTIDNKMVATITSGKSSHKMIALSGSDFPQTPDLVSDRSFIIGQSVLKKMLSQVSFAMANNDTQRHILNGAFLKIDDNSVTAVACDSFKLAKCKRRTELVNKNTNGKDYLDYAFIVPTKTVNELIRLLDDDEDAVTQLYVTRKHIVCIIGEITFFSRLVDGEYIDFNRLIVTNHAIKSSVDRSELLGALERAALITEEKVERSVRAHVKVEFWGDLLKISAISPIGSTYDELAIDHAGNDITIAFNNRFFMDSVRSCTAEKVVLELSSPLNSMNIVPVDNNYEENGVEEVFMLLPVRTKE